MQSCSGEGHEDWSKGQAVEARLYYMFLAWGWSEGIFVCQTLVLWFILQMKQKENDRTSPVLSGCPGEED